MLLRTCGGKRWNKWWKFFRIPQSSDKTIMSTQLNCFMDESFTSTCLNYTKNSTNWKWTARWLIYTYFLLILPNTTTKIAYNNKLVCDALDVKKKFRKELRNFCWCLGRYTFVIYSWSGIMCDITAWILNPDIWNVWNSEITWPNAWIWYMQHKSQIKQLRK
jgi:hypothetical protein